MTPYCFKTLSKHASLLYLSESTRQVYQKKLAILLRGGGGLPSAEGTSNGNGDEASYSSPPAETVEETTNRLIIYLGFTGWKLVVRREFTDCRGF